MSLIWDYPQRTDHENVNKLVIDETAIEIRYNHFILTLVRYYIQIYTVGISIRTAIRISQLQLYVPGERW